MSLVMERAVVVHDPQRITAEAVQAIIEERGFEAEVLFTDLPSPVAVPTRRSAAYDRSLDGGSGTNEDSEPPVTQTTVAIKGMTCGACTSAVEGAFKGVDGVKSFSISLLSERAVLEHDASKLSAQQIVDKIEDCGFDATIVESEVRSRIRADGAATDLDAESDGRKRPSSTTTTVAIEGMTCGACTSAVEGGFKDVPGVLRFNISLLAERAVITHDPVVLSPHKIVEIIEERGFDAKIISTVSDDSENTNASSVSHFKIYGNPDAKAAEELEEKVRSLNGVVSVRYSMSSSRLTVTHRPSVMGLRAIVEAVDSLGLNALVADNDDNNAQLESLAKTKEINEWRRAFKISLGFAIPVFVLNMIIPMCLPAIDMGRWMLIPGLYAGDIVSLLLTIPVQFGIGKRFYVSAWKSVKHGSPTMDVLVVLGTSCAFFFSVVAMIVSILIPPHSRPSTIFDTSTMLITFITLGRFLENRAKGQTSRALSRLMSLAPSMATIYADPIAAEKQSESWDAAATSGEAKTPGREGNAYEEKTIPTELIQVGDIVILRPGDKIPADGILVRGETYVDESMVTGEAMPVQKKKGSFVIGGTVNSHGRVDFRVTRAGRDTQLAQIVRLVQDAQTTRAPIQRLADTLAGYFVPAILILGTLTFVVWMILSHVLPNPPKIFLQESSGGKLMVCVKLCISVIVFACPCALGLATPTAVMVGTGVGAENGILVKGGAALETTTKVTQIVLDKTGTITYGKMKVASSGMAPAWSTDESQRRLWWMCVGLAEMGSEHPVGKAVLAAAKAALGLDAEAAIDGSVGDFRAVVGRGISATVEPAVDSLRVRYKVLVGSALYLRQSGIQVPEEAMASPKDPAVDDHKAALEAGTTRVFVAIDGHYAGHLCLRDTVKVGAAAAISVLHRMGVKTAIVTGDQESTALAVAAAVGIPAAHVYAGVSPDQKQAIVRELQAQGEVVAMVGDGINDSPALATADVGIAMSSGTDVAMEAADVVLMRPDDLMDVAAALHLARAIFGRIKLNLAWACLYNVVGLPFAMGFFLPFGLHLHPMMAGAAMAASSVSVVVSSLLLRFWKRPRFMEDALAAEREAAESNGRVAGGGRIARTKARQSRRDGFVGEVGARIRRAFGAVTGLRRKEDEGYVPLDTLPDV